MTIKDACQAVGIARSTYYYILAKNEKAIAELQLQLMSDTRVRLANILASRLQLLEKVIDDALDETTTPRERLAIYKALEEVQDRLVQALRQESQDMKIAAEMLNRPTLRLGKSRVIANSSDVIDEG